MRVLITGATGLIGSHLASYLLQRRVGEVWGLRRWRSSRHEPPGLRSVEGDVTDYLSLADVVARCRPDVVFHLAAQSYTAPSFEAPRTTWEVNVIGTLNLLEAIRRAPRKPEVILVAGSAAVYGQTDRFPTQEDTALRPVSPYGASKAAQELLAGQYFRSYGLPILVTRSYIHVGTRQGLHNAVQNFAWQVARAEVGLQEPVVRVGNLETRRDILDVRDAVRALWLLVELGTPGETYNVCRGEAYRIGDLLDHLIRLARRELRVEVDQALLRPTDPALEVGSRAKLTAATGWEPVIPIAETLTWVLEWRRAQARGAAAENAGAQQESRGNRDLTG